MARTNNNKLTEDQTTEIKEAFELFKNDKGKMEYNQVKYACRALGIEPTEESLTASHKKGQKAMSYTSFLELVSPLIPKRDNLSTLEQAFKLFDRDESGKITLQDLKSVAINIGEECSDRDLLDMIEFADMNGDNAIDKDEFMTLMTATKKVL